MKILLLAPYTYDEELKPFTKNKTGFGMMINNIVQGINKEEEEEIYLLTRAIVDNKNIPKEKPYIINHRWFDVISNSSMHDWMSGVKIFVKTKGSIREKMRQAYFLIDCGYTRKIIKTINPDIINIHGIGTITNSYIEICKSNNIPYVITLHGLIGLNDSLNVSEHVKNLEKNILIYCDKKQVPISVISTGIKKRIEERYYNHSANNIRVICNGTEIQKKKRSIINDKKIYNFDKFREQYPKIINSGNFPTLKDIEEFLKFKRKLGSKIIFIVGNITKNKNQLFAVKAIKDLNIKDLILVIFGNECDNNETREYIIKNKLYDKVFLAGYCDNLDMFWKYANINLFVSLNDGFGLSIIEGYTYGIPCVSYNDLDAINDVYNENAMIKLSDRSEETLQMALKRSFSTDWDKEKIIKYSENFSLKKMIEKYIELFYEIKG